MSYMYLFFFLSDKVTKVKKERKNIIDFLRKYDIIIDEI